MYLDLMNANLKIYNMDGETLESKQFDFQRNNMFLEELGEFMECVLNKKETSIPISQGMFSLKTALAAKKSLEQKNAVLVERRV